MAEPLERIARHFEGHAGHICEDEVVHVSEGLAVSIGFQRGDPGGDAADSAEETLLRVTHVYRREEGTWKIVHRHADSQRAAEAIRPEPRDSR